MHKKILILALMAVVPVAMADTPITFTCNVGAVSQPVPVPVPTPTPNPTPNPTPTPVPSTCTTPATITSIPWGAGVNWVSYTVVGSQTLAIAFKVTSPLQSHELAINFSNTSGSNQFDVQLSDQPCFGPSPNPNMGYTGMFTGFGGHAFIWIVGTHNPYPPTALPLVTNLTLGKTYYLVVRNHGGRGATETLSVSMPI